MIAGRASPSSGRCFAASQNRRRIEPVLRQLSAIAPLTEAEVLIVSRLAEHPEPHRAGTELIAEGTSGPSRALLSGWACRQRLLPDGRRQIFGFVLPGDILGFCVRPGSLDRTCVLALTHLETANASSLRTAALDAATHPALAAAFAAGPSLEDGRLLDHLVRLGRLSGYERTAHLIIDLQQRLLIAGVGNEKRFPLPVTQEVLADALGLSVVHINRVLAQLRREGLIDVRSGELWLLDPAGLSAASGGAGRTRPEQVLSLP